MMSGENMRALVVAAALALCLAGRVSASEYETKSGQVVCDTLLAFEELTIAIGEKDDRSIQAMSGRGCHLPQPGSRMELIEAYPDQTVLLFGKLSEYTHVGPVPPHIERMTNLAKVRLFAGDATSTIGFTLVPVLQHTDGRPE
jgi:hypothetical protein